jgi:hypothetical protein
MKPLGAGEARAVFFGEKKQGGELMNPQMTQMDADKIELKSIQ